MSSTLCGSRARSKFVKKQHCAAAFFLQVPKLFTSSPRLDSTLLSCTFCFSKHMPNSYAPIKCQRSVFASRSPARALEYGLPRQDHVYSSNTCQCNVHTCICTGAQDACLVQPHPSQQMQINPQIHPHMRAYATVQQLKLKPYLSLAMQ